MKLNSLVNGSPRCLDAEISKVPHSQKDTTGHAVIENVHVSAEMWKPLLQQVCDQGMCVST